MSGNQGMVVLIVLIVMVAGIIRTYLGGGRSKRGRHGQDLAAMEDNAETQRLREEVKQLKERLAVLERITVEKESTLEREIERLRDR
ncbi:MAG TPA: hypothetical protein VIT45_14765 [Allosphingosinicella sp.]